MTEQAMKQRTKAFPLRELKLIDALPDTRSGRILAGQLGRSGTSVGANYRAACRSRSRAEMISKLSIMEEGADESGFWIELLGEHGVQDTAQLAPLQREANEITAMMVASRRTHVDNDRKSRIQNRK